MFLEICQDRVVLILLNKEILLKRSFFVNIRYRKPSPNLLIFVVVDMRASNVIKMKSQYRHFLVKLAKFLRTAPDDWILNELSFHPSKHIAESNLMLKFAQGILCIWTSSVIILVFLNCKNCNSVWGIYLFPQVNPSVPDVH